MKNSTVVLGSFGPECPRCGRATEVRAHAKIGPKQLQQPFYYKRWFYCTHEDCITKNIMLEEYKHWNDNEQADLAPRA
jgi:hypothetical protein